MNVVRSLFNRKEVTKKANERQSFSQAKPMIVEDLKAQLQHYVEEIEKYENLKRAEEENIREYSRRIEEIQANIPENAASLIEEKEIELQDLVREIEQLKTTYYSLQKENTEKSKDVSLMNGTDLTEIQKIRYQKYRMALDPQAMIQEYSIQLKIKKDKLNLVNKKLELISQKELDMINVEAEYKELQEKLNLINKNIENTKNLEDEEKRLTKTLENLKNTAGKSKVIDHYRNSYEYELRTKNMHMVINQLLNDSYLELKKASK